MLPFIYLMQSPIKLVLKKLFKKLSLKKQKIPGKRIQAETRPGVLREGDLRGRQEIGKSQGWGAGLGEPRLISLWGPSTCACVPGGPHCCWLIRRLKVLQGEGPGSSVRAAWSPAYGGKPLGSPLKMISLPPGLESGPHEHGFTG